MENHRIDTAHSYDTAALEILFDDDHSLLHYVRPISFVVILCCGKILQDRDRFIRLHELFDGVLLCKCWSHSMRKLFRRLLLNNGGNFVCCMFGGLLFEYHWLLKCMYKLS